VRSYPPREYCVQYRETHLAFVSRLLEDEGIFYYFEHHEDKHVLVLGDAPSAARPCPANAALQPATAGGAAWTGGRDAYTRLAVDRAMHTAKVTLTDYDYGAPSTSLEASARGRR
jgi:type VI secretion system secreted protein VgrG